MHQLYNVKIFNLFLLELSSESVMDMILIVFYLFIILHLLPEEEFFRKHLLLLVNSINDLFR